MSTGVTLQGVYDLRLVALSAIIATFASYAALDLAEQVSSARAWNRRVLISCAALALGVGLWAGQFAAMLALSLPIPVLYHWPTLLLSALVAVCACWGSLLVFSRSTMGFAESIAGGGVMGFGILAMNYIGISAMRLQATRSYSPGIIALSILLAIATSSLALRLAFGGRESRTLFERLKIGSAILIGLPILVLDYVARAGVSFSADATLRTDLDQSIFINPLGFTVVAAAAAILLFHACVISSVRRRFMEQNNRLRESQVELQAIFDNMTHGIIVIDPEKRHVQLNRTAAMGLGRTETSFTYEREADIWSQFDTSLPDGEPLPVDHVPLVRALRGEFVRDFELAVRERDTGELLVLGIDTVPILNDAGQTTKIIVSSHDITERIKVNEARARLIAIVESSEDAIIGKDLSGIVTDWNRGAEKLFGYTAQEMTGQSIRILLPPELEEDEDEILRRIAGGELVQHTDTVRVKKSGERVHVAVAVSPIRNARGEIVGASKIASDITARKKLERQLHQSQKMDALGQMTGGIAHDFNNLLGVIIGNLDLLERAVGDSPAALKRVQTAQKAALRGADLTRRLLAFSSREALNPAPISIEATVREVAELAGRTLGPEIRIYTVCGEDIPPIVVDAAGLESALLNLALNARDAMPRGGSLTIAAGAVELVDSYHLVQAGDLKAGPFVRITVTDSGSGMSREVMEHAFEPFFTTKPWGKGTGLGLPMVYGFIKQSGGAIRLYSEERIGTTVSLYLPIAAEYSKPVVEPLPDEPQQKLGGTALVVDDELDLLDVARAYLEELGYAVLAAPDAATALEIASNTPEIDLLVTDIIMPGNMNGMELAQTLRELRPGIRVVFTSGFPAEALGERSGKLVDGPLLHKPYLRTEFADVVLKTMSANLKYERFGNKSSTPDVSK
jgi:PAS domain S-box-containing protein